MIGRLLGRGVALSLAGEPVRAATPQGLRTALAGHVALGPPRLASLAGLGDRALGARLDALDALASRLEHALARGEPLPEQLLAEVQERDAPLDGGWDEIVAAARAWPASRTAFRRVVLEALAAHLRGECDCARTLLSARARVAGAAPDPDGAARQRLILDVAGLTGDTAPAFARLTRGDPLAVPMAAGQSLELLLAQHRFLLVCGTPWLLIDDTGEDLRLASPHSVVGRSTDCDALVHESYRAISRRHLALELRGTSGVTLTDLSSLGTCVPREVLAGAAGGPAPQTPVH